MLNFHKNLLVIPVFLALLILQPNLGLAQALPEFTKIIKTEKSKVVHIATTTKMKTDLSNDPFFKFFPDAPRQRTERALGSGFFYTSDGFIITNNHVIKEADTIEVVLDDNRSFQAELVGADARTDLALLKINSSKKFSAVEFGDSDKVEIGQWVLAIGNPLGLDQTVTVGIISAKGRDVLGGTAYGKFLQTDAAINFGNSGGPLIDAQGKVIGINTAIAGGSQGLGFAIPSNLARNVIEQLKAKGQVTRGWLGVGIQELTPELAESLKLKNGQRGVLISQVFPNSPAKKAGLEEQDIVVALNGTPVLGNSDLQLMIAETTPGTRITLTVLREGKPIKRSVVISEFKEENVRIAQRSSKSALGLDLVNITPKVKSEYGLVVNRGILVTAIAPDSPFRESLQASDVILKVNTNTVNNIKEFEENLSKIKPKVAFVLLINRNGFQMVVPAKLN